MLNWTNHLVLDLPDQIPAFNQKDFFEKFRFIDIIRGKIPHPYMRLYTHRLKGLKVETLKPDHSKYSKVLQSPPFKRIATKLTISKKKSLKFILERSFNKILPRPLARSHTVAVDEMETTNGHFHDRKTHQTPLTNVAYKRAPGSHKVHYMKHNLEVSSNMFLYEHLVSRLRAKFCRKKQHQDACF